jgi:serine/threonine-protein kinase
MHAVAASPSCFGLLTTQAGEDPNLTQLTGSGPPAAALGSGSVLGGRYFLGRPLGRGGLGIVYEGRDLLRGGAVAVKVLAPQWAWNREAHRRLAIEAELADRVRHPAVVRVLDVAASAQEPFFVVLEYVAGRDLHATLMDRGPLSPREATRYVAAACGALRAVHAAGLVHLDVKPHNLLLPDRGRVKLADFGVARPLGHMGTVPPGCLEGTPAYMAPEQAWGLPLGPRSDLYSLGATYYELLTGAAPYAADSVQGYACLHRDAPVPDPRECNSAVPAACARVVRRALAKDPAERYPDAEEMLSALRAALAHPAVRAR